MARQALKTYLKLLSTMLFWGGTFIAGRSLAGVVPPGSAAFLRFAVASALLLVLLRTQVGAFPRLEPKQWGAVFLLGLTGVFGYNVCFFAGLKTVTAGRAALIVALNPVGIALFSALLGQERMTGAKALGVLVSVLGGLWVVSGGQLRTLLEGGLGRGELLIFGCVLCWSSYTILGRHVMRSLSPLTAVTYSALLGAALLFPLAVSQGLLAEFLRYDLRAWLGLLYLGIFGTVIGFVWYYQAVKAIGPARAGVFINFVPVGAVTFAFFLLGEPLTPSLVMGGVLVVIGVLMTSPIVSGRIARVLSG